MFPPVDETGFKTMFDGKSLAGWDCDPEFWRVENGVMKVSYEKYDTFNKRYGHIFYKDKFSYYRLVVEYRFTGEQCAGGGPRHGGAV